MSEPLDYAGALRAYLERHEHPSGADDTHAHASEAGQCARAIWYRIRRTPLSNPPTLAGLIAMEVGSQMGSSLVEGLREAAAGRAVEREVFWTKGRVSGHADALYFREGAWCVAEFKCVTNPWAWKNLTEPRAENLLQVQVNALGLDAPTTHLIYIHTSATAGGKDSQEVPVREYLSPLDTKAATSEMKRLEMIARLGQEGWIQPLRIYQGAEIAPERGQYPCSYCRYREQCLGDGPGGGTEV